MARLEIPDPCLVVLVGAAGAGKTTFAARRFAPDEVLSSDSMRGLVSGDEADQRASRTAFAILHRVLDRRLALGRTTVVDATNVTAVARLALLRRAAAHGVPALAIVLDLDPGLVMARNETRVGRVVPAEAVRRQLDALARALGGELAREPFARVVVLRTPAEVDALEVVRVPPGRQLP